MANKKEFEKPTIQELPKFTKAQIVGSQKYKRFKDFLNGNLNNSKMYTLEEVDALISKNYKKGTGEIKWL